MEKICVAVRVRPSKNEEIINGFEWKVENNRISLHRSHGTPILGLSYAFDHVFDQNCSNAEVYELLTKDIIHAAVDGFNGTAFAYGQTSSGKTFTMNGSENDPGIINQAVKGIFTKIQKTTDREFLIRVSYMEIYNEDINDLLTVENQKLQIHESLERGVFVAGLKEEIVNSVEQVLTLIQLGEVNRHFGETNMNARSSRSHTIFRMVIESKGKDTASSSDDVVRVSVLNLVDLAGSERIAKTGAGGVRLKEGKHINKSLMVLGNVINKLSEGAKQRAHIPYRDSKLTRILQPALGGNAKTSIICTVAPEEIHIEETKGTLLFASRAKRITNCVQVNEILTDTALLKRQKQEIEELRMKLQGSRAEVLEQEILKLRNDMLKYEVEREKLAMELEEERRSHKERDRCIKEQQMKNTLSNSGGCCSQDGIKESPVEGSNDDDHIVFQEADFSTPCFKTVPNTFVVKRSQYLQPESSPLPDAFHDFADEDTWMKMNKGYIADLDSLHMTSARKLPSFPVSEEHSIGKDNIEIQNLHRELKLMIEERDELKRSHLEQMSFNNQLQREISELQQEIKLMRELPQTLNEAVSCCKHVYEDIFSNLKSFVSNEKSAAAQIISTTSDIGAHLFSTLEYHLSMAIEGNSSLPTNNYLTQKQCDVLSKKLNRTFLSSVLPNIGPEGKSEGSHCSVECKDTLGGKISHWKKALEDKMTTIKQKCLDLKKQLDVNNQLLEVSEGKYRSLEREFHLLKQDRDGLLQKVSNSSQVLSLVDGQKERILQDLNTEVQRRRNLEGEIKQFSVAFACRQRSIMSFHSDFKSILDNIKAQHPTSFSKALGS